MPALIRRPTRSGSVPASAPRPHRAGHVAAADGTSLYVEEHGDLDAPVTAVLTHGWTLDRRTWDAQVTGLPFAVDSPVRIVTYDHRGHGLSEPTTRESATLAQLGDDLAAVLRARVPGEPVVLAGHSMGGMTIMALAERHPELFAHQVAGAVFVSTSSGGLDRVTYGLPAALAPVLRRVEEIAGRAMTARAGPPYASEHGAEAAGHAGEAAGTDAAARAPAAANSGHGRRAVRKAAALRPGARWLLFGERPAREQLGRTAAAIAATPPDSVVGFRATLGEHDRAAALAACRALPTVVACGTKDRLCPSSHSRSIAQAVPGSQLVLYPGAGHLLPLERANEVTGHIAGIVRAAAPAG